PRRPSPVRPPVSHMRIPFAAAALLAAAVPLSAQNAPTHRFDAGSFVIELPRDVPGMTLINVRDDPTQRGEGFIGGTAARDVLVMVTHIQPRAVPNDTTAAVRNVFEWLKSDTTLATQRVYLQTSRLPFVRATDWIMLDAQARELVTDERVALRSPMTLRLDNGTLFFGTADMLVSRRGGLETWLVAYLSRTRTPEHDAAAVRMLDSFR